MCDVSGDHNNYASVWCVLCVHGDVHMVMWCDIYTRWCLYREQCQ